MWNDDLKKSLVKLACELQYGCAYLYVYAPYDDAPYRFYFNIFGSRRMWRAVRFWRNRGFRVNIWRPPSL